MRVKQSYVKSILFALGLIVSIDAAYGAGGSARSGKTFGIIGTYFGNTLSIGGGLAYQGSVARLSAEYSQRLTPTPARGNVAGTLQFFIPKWSLSPTLGVRANYPLATPATLTVGAIFGLDFQTRFGLSLAGGIHYTFVGGNGFVPYAQIGFFFGKGK